MTRLFAPFYTYSAVDLVLVPVPLLQAPRIHVLQKPDLK